MGLTKRIDEMIYTARCEMEKRIGDYTLNETTEFDEYRNNILKYAKEPIRTLGLSPRSYRILTEEGFKTIGELLGITKEELYHLKKGFGKKSAGEVESSVKRLGLKLSEVKLVRP